MKYILLFCFIVQAFTTQAQSFDEYAQLRKNMQLPDISIEEVNALTEKLQRVPVDGYNLSFEKLMASRSNTNKRIGKIQDDWQTWFYNAQKNEALVCSPGTDMVYYDHMQFRPDEIPTELIEKIVLYEVITEFDAEYASVSKKAVALPKFATAGKKVDAKLLTSINKFSLGASKDSVLAFYGQPDSTATLDGYERCEWRLHSPETLAIYGGWMKEHNRIPKHMSADNKAGREIMYFKGGDLIARIMLITTIPMVYEPFRDLYK